MLTILIALACVVIISSAAELIASIVVAVCGAAFITTACACVIGLLEMFAFHSHYVLSWTAVAWSYVLHLVF